MSRQLQTWDPPLRTGEWTSGALRGPGLGALFDPGFAVFGPAGPSGPLSGEQGPVRRHVLVEESAYGALPPLGTLWGLLERGGAGLAANVLMGGGPIWEGSGLFGRLTDPQASGGVAEIADMLARGKGVTRLLAHRRDRPVWEAVVRLPPPGAVPGDVEDALFRDAWTPMATACPDDGLPPTTGGEVRSVGVFGHGQVGRGLVNRCVAAGLDVVAVVRDPAKYAGSPATLVTDAAAVTSCDVVLDCLPEDLGLKRTLLCAVERPLLTMSSTYVGAEIRAGAGNLHPLTPLEEGRFWEYSLPVDSAENLAVATGALCSRLGVTPVPAPASRGLVMTRFVCRYLAEGVRLAVGRGVALDAMDAWFAPAGWRVSPAQMRDFVGPGLAEAACRSLAETLGDRFHTGDWRALDGLPGARVPPDADAVADLVEACEDEARRLVEEGVPTALVALCVLNVAFPVPFGMDTRYAHVEEILARLGS